MKNFFVKHKSEILIGLLTSILGTILWNFLGVFFSALPDAGNSIVIAWGNAIYESAGSITPYAFSLETRFGFVLLFIIIICVNVVYRIKHIKKTNKVIKYARLSETERNLLLISDEMDESIDIASFQEQDVGKLMKNAQKKRNADIRSLFSDVILNIIALIITLSCILYPALLNNKFVRASTIIHPYITEEQYIQLQSDWCRMKSKDDYDAINEFIIDIQNENQLW